MSPGGCPCGSARGGIGDGGGVERNVATSASKMLILFMIASS
jgi:hypothetical protein